nr:Peptide G protein-coupled receptor [Hymenolepis microstoma]
MEIRKAKIICDKFALSHFAMGFVLYFCTGKNFREEVARILGRLCCRKPSKHRNNTRNSSVSENPHSVASNRLSRDTRRAESIVTSKVAPRKKKLKILKESIPFLKRGRSRDDFPGLELCGQRGERQPSKLQLTSKKNFNIDTLVSL